jgi:amino acid transporter
MKSETVSRPVVTKPSFLRTIRAVAWSFVGIRKSSGLQEDMVQIKPFHVIAVGLIGVLLLVASLIVLVNWVVAK